MILVLDGRGSTSVWNDAGSRITFEWKAGALFAIPLNTWHQHFNGSGREGARYVAVTNPPPVLNLYEDIGLVVGTKHDFRGRLHREPHYVSANGAQKRLLPPTTFVPGPVHPPCIAPDDR